MGKRSTLFRSGTRRLRKSPPATGENGTAHAGPGEAAEAFAPRNGVKRDEVHAEIDGQAVDAELALAALRIATCEGMALTRRANLYEAKQSLHAAKLAFKEVAAHLEDLLATLVAAEPDRLCELMRRIKVAHCVWRDTRDALRRARAIYQAARTEFHETRESLEKTIDDSFLALPLFDREPAEVEA